MSRHDFISVGRVGLGAALYSLGVFLFALNDALGKWLIADYGVGQLMMLRSVGAGVVLAPMVWSLRVDLFEVGQWRLQTARILAMATDTFAFYLATRYLPLADVMTFYMAAPLMLVALSAPLLGEKVERFRWIAVSRRLRRRGHRAAADVVNVLIGVAARAVRLDHVRARPDATRKLRRTHWLALTVWQFVGAGLIGAATTPFAWTTPGRFDLR